MSRMNSRAVFEAAKVGSLAALWSRIDAGTFPPPSSLFSGERYWNASAVATYAEALAKLKDTVVSQAREQPQPPTTTRERKDDPRTQTRESE